MPTKQQYEDAIARATADGNTEAVAELQRRLASEHPKQSANAGDSRKAKRRQQREAREADAVVVPKKSEKQFNKAIKAAEADGNDEAVTELKLFRAIRRAERDGNDEAVTELKSRLVTGESGQAADTRINVRNRVAQGREDAEIIRQFGQVDPRTLTEEQTQTLRGAYERELERSQEEAEMFNRIATGEVQSAADKARGYGTILAESASMGLIGDEAVAGLRSIFSDEDYDTLLQDTREQEARFRQENPALSIGTDIVGGLATGGAIYKGLGAAAESGSWLMRGMKGAGIGAGEGAVMGFMEGEDTLGDRVGTAVQYGKTGALLGAGGSVLADGISMAIAKKSGVDPRAQYRDRVENERDVRQIQEGQAEAQYNEMTRWEETEIEDIREAAKVALAGDFRAAMRRSGATNAEEFAQRAEFREFMGEGLEAYVNKYGIDNATAVMDSVRGMSAKELDEFLEVPMLRDVNAKQAGKVEEFQDTAVSTKVANFLTPAMRSAVNRVGEGFAETLNNGLNMALRNKEIMGQRVVRPISESGIFEAVDDSREIKRLLLNAFNTQLSGAKRANYLSAAKSAIAGKTKLSRAEVDEAFETYFRERGLHAVQPYLDIDATTPLDNRTMHTARFKELDDGTEGAMKTDEQEKLSRLGSNMAVRPVTRPEFKKGDKAVDEYMNPFDSDNRWMSERITDTALGNQFALRAARTDVDRDLVEKGTYVRTAIKERMTELGYTDKQVANAESIVEATTVSALEKMNPFLSAVRSLSFLGTIANPKSALLNLSDPFSAGAQVGYVNLLRTFFDDANIKYSAEDMGLAQVVTGDVLKQVKNDVRKGGQSIEAVDRGLQDALNKSMKISGFENSTTRAQDRIMKAALLKGRGRMKSKKAEAKFDREFSSIFNKDELATLKDVLKRSRTKAGVQKVENGRAVSSLTAKEENVIATYMLSELSKTQPINALGRSLFNIKNRNGRIITLLTTWSIRNADLMRQKLITDTVKAYKAGRKKEAFRRFAHGIFAITASVGGFGLVNQARQEVFGAQLGNLAAATGVPQALGYERKETDDKWRKFDWEGVLEDMYYSVITLPFGGFLGNNEIAMNELTNKPLKALGETFMPPLPFPEAIQEDLQNAFDEDEEVSFDTLGRAPVIGPFVKGIQRTFEEE